MSREKDVVILNVKNTDEYVVKDKDKINIGGFTIVDMDKNNRKCNINLKFYRKENYNLLKQTLKLLLKAVFKDENLNKVNIVTSEELNLSAFLDLGFTLEGIFCDNLYCQGVYKNEVSFGISRAEYKQGERVSFSKIEFGKYYMRILTPEDAEELTQYYIRNKEHLASFEPAREKEFYTVESQKSILNDNYTQFLNGTAIDFGVFEEEKLIGKLRISSILYGVVKSGILGYSIDKEKEGQGIITSAVNLIIEYAFNELGLHRIEASVLVDNEKYKRVLNKCGFKELGLNEKYLFIDGIWRDHVTFFKINNKQLQ